MGHPFDSLLTIFSPRARLALLALALPLAACGPDEPGDDGEEAAYVEEAAPDKPAPGHSASQEEIAEARARREGRHQARENELIRNELYKARRLNRKLEQRLAQERADLAQRGYVPPVAAAMPASPTTAPARTWQVQAPPQRSWKAPERVSIRSTALDQRREIDAVAARAAEASAAALREEAALR